MRKLILLAALVPALCYSEVTPLAGRFDPRVRTVAYNPQDLVVVTAYFGVSTPIRFADDEVIEKESIDAGDRKAWSIKVSARGNILFLRPVAPNADTNITVVTNKRVYLFLLNVLADPQPGRKGGKGKGGSKGKDFAPVYSMAAARSRNLTFSLTFTYLEDGRKNEGRKTADALRAQMESGRKHAKGGDYWVAGDEEVAPIDARDDGRFIYLTFARNRSLPEIAGVDGHGNPTALNVVVDGDTVIIDRMVSHLVLRKGAGKDDPVACVVNRAFRPDGGPEAGSSTGTIAPNVLRVIKGGDK